MLRMKMRTNLYQTTALTSQADAPFPSACLWVIWRPHNTVVKWNLQDVAYHRSCAVKGLVRLSCASVLNSESQHVHACNHLWFSERNSWCNHEDELSRCVHWEVAMMKYMLPGEACFLSTKKCHLHQNKDNLVLLNVLTDYSPATKQSRHKNWQN